MIVGSIKENTALEKRVSLTPESAKNIIGLGLKVCVEKGYALHLGIEDKEYKDIEAKIYYGGPVSVDTIHFIHKKNSFVIDSEKISNEIYWGKDFNEIIKLIRQKKVDINDVKFFIGYSGWDYDQLGRELDENSWLVLKNYDSNDIFKTKNELWKNKLISFGEKYKLWANSPENPNYN